MPPALESPVKAAPRKKAGKNGAAQGAAPQPAAPQRAAVTAIAEDTELIADFVVEAREHLKNIESNLLQIERDSANTEAIHGAFRAFHTIKGLAGFLEYLQLQEACHEIETLLDSARNGELELTAAVIDVILDGSDYVSRAVEQVDSALRAHRPARPADDPQRLIEAIRFIRLSSDKNQASPGSTVAEVSDNVHHEDAAPAEESLEALALFVESPVLSEPVNQRADSVEKAAPPAPQPEVAPKDAAPKESSAPAAGHASGAHSAGFIKVDAGKLDALIDMVGEMVIAQSMVRHNPDLAQLESPLLSKSLMQLARITAEIQKSAMSLRMVQVEGLFQRMARLVRDLCRKSGKEAQLRTFGGDTELDRNIVEQLGDPLMHMVRNSMDHGIENREDRIKAGKNPVATISLHASHQAGNILIEITDDGRGMNRNKILSKAIERGIVPPNAQLTDDEVYAMIFHPGFSTADQVTEISGRGVGMDVVRQHIHSLRGTIEIRTEQGHGTTFRLTLPLTLAIIDGLIAGVGTERYIVPIFMVKEVLRPTPEMLSTIEGTREVVNIRGDVLPVVRLCHRFGIEPLSTEAAETVLIVTESQGREFCLMVDELLGKQEVVIKSLGSAFRNVRGLAGGAILGDGRVGLILDITSLFGRNQS